MTFFGQKHLQIKVLKPGNWKTVCQKFTQIFRQSWTLQSPEELEDPELNG